MIYNPTPEEIAREAAKIRQCRLRKKRAGRKSDAVHKTTEASRRNYYPNVVSTNALPNRDLLQYELDIPRVI